MSASNIEIVKNVYAAFQRADIGYILDQLDDRVEWKEAEVKEVPYSGVYHGKAAIPAFFQGIGESLEVLAFTPASYMADGEQVAAFGNWQARVRSTQKTFHSDWAMRWTFRDGKVVAFQGYIDTAAEAAAFRA